ncbi:MAG TPA: hypothetical protein VGX68_17440 [Thermoanaerobaculia bacterium]|nr:hypothetical protein [Thermoanaerobaculia bacterium]
MKTRGSEHPSGEELSALGQERLPPSREKEVVRHLLFARCPACLASLPPALTTLLGLAPARRPTPEEGAAYEAVIERAAAKPLALARHLREQRAEADRCLKLLAAGRKLPRAMQPLARMWALLDRSWQLRFEDPARMIELAEQGVVASFRLDEAIYGRPLRCDLQARAYADLGNACRVTSRFGDAREFLGDARHLFEQGTGDRLLEMRLLEFEATLLAQRGSFGPATQKLHQMLTFHQGRGDRHLVGYTLVKLGVYAYLEGRFDLAVQRQKQSLEMIDTERDPGLACAAAHNLILYLVDSGRIAEAKKHRLLHSRRLLHPGGRINRIKFRHLEARIAFGEGGYQRAEALFREVREGYAQAGLSVFAGIAMLDLTASLLAQGRGREAEHLATEAATLFSTLEIQREALQAVILLRDAFRMRTATVAKVLEVADFLRWHADFGPNLRFEARAWEE